MEIDTLRLRREFNCLSNDEGEDSHKLRVEIVFAVFAVFGHPSRWSFETLKNNMTSSERGSWEESGKKWGVEIGAWEEVVFMFGEKHEKTRNKVEKWRFEKNWKY